MSDVQYAPAHPLDRGILLWFTLSPESVPPAPEIPVQFGAAVRVLLLETALLVAVDIVAACPKFVRSIVPRAAIRGIARLERSPSQG